VQLELRFQRDGCRLEEFDVHGLIRRSCPS
jgi:hypothetical protein